MKYTLVLNVRTASGQSSAVNIDLPIEGMDAINAFGVVVRSIVETVHSQARHAVTREELLGAEGLKPGEVIVQFSMIETVLLNQVNDSITGMKENFTAGT